jgi:threonine/homoserine/homoserine lactone efflux protein
VPSLDTLVVFFLVAVAFAAIPGPSNLFVMAQGLQRGSRAATAGAVGCASGAMVYVAATAAGLAAVLASSQVLLNIVHYAGVAYLVWLGIAALRAAPTAEADHAARGEQSSRSVWRSYRQGLLVELGNPKVALFFVALFPQFLHAGAGPAVLQIAILGTIFVAVGLASDSLYALGSGRVNAWLTRRPRRRVHQQRATGLLYLGLGGWAALSGTGTHRTDG